jgi:hypothetical protein
MQVLNVILMLGVGLVSASACANIYGYIDEQGAAHFATEKDRCALSAVHARQTVRFV